MGLILAPTTVIILGNLKIGTILMNCDQTIGLDLPLRVLVNETNDGATFLSSADPENHLRSYSLTNCEEVINNLRSARKGLNEIAAN